MKMQNGVGIVHGGVTFSLADSAFAFACNNINNLSPTSDISISFIKPVHVSDMLTAEAKELHNVKYIGLYQTSISNQNDHIIALFKGTCFRNGKKLLE